MEIITDGRKESLILLVDDQIENLHLLGNILSDYRKAVSKSGEEAVEIALKTRPDLIILDIMMPVMDGFQVCQILKSKPETRDIPIIFVTALTRKDDIIKGFELGGCDFILKPFDSRELLMRVNTHLDLRRARETVIRQNEFIRKISSIKSNLLSIGAHDLKNPLKIIQGFSKMMLERYSSFTEVEIHEFLNDIHDSADAMVKIISDILDVFDLSEGRVEIMPENINAGELLNIVINEHTNHAYSKNIKIFLENNAREAVIFSDFPKIRQVLNNILSNAIKFSPFNNKIRIILGNYKDKSDNSEFTKIDIIDHGPGIKSEELPRIFDIFGIHPNRPTAGEPSTGLGLALVKGISELLKCRIECHSRVGKGTTFSLFIPKNKANTNK